MNTHMLPLLGVALLIWGAVFAFLIGLERRVAGLERQLGDQERRFTESGTSQ